MTCDMSQVTRANSQVTCCFRVYFLQQLIFRYFLRHFLYLGAEQFQFSCRVIFDSFCLNWFKLVSSQPNLQLKKKVIVADFKFVDLITSYFFHIMMAASLKDTRRQLCV